MRVVTEDHAIAVHDWRVQSTKPERKQRTAEEVVLLSKRKADDYVEVELELDELDLTTAESKATYAEIKSYHHLGR